MAIALQQGCGSTSQFFTESEQTYTCGYNIYGQLGLGHTATVYVPTLLPGSLWVQFASSQFWSGAVTADGKMYSCGDPAYNKLGYTAGANVLTFTQIGTANNWAAIACGPDFGCAFTTTGVLYGWGRNNYGTVGNGTTIQADTPTVSSSMSGKVVVQISVGGGHCLARTSDGKLWATGWNTQGQLGLNNTTSPYTNYTQVGTSTLWTQVSAGAFHSAGIQTSGTSKTLWVWGYNFGYELGLNDTTNRLVPTQIAGTDWEEVWCGTTHTCARKTDGSIWSWGANSLSQLVQGDTVTRQIPTRIGTSTWSKVGTSDRDIYALAGSRVWGGGSNSEGELGLNDTTARPTMTLLTPTFPVVQAVTDVGIATALLMVLSDDYVTETTTATDNIGDIVYTMVLESIAAVIAASPKSVSSISAVSSGSAQAVLQQGINQIVTETASGAEGVSLAAAVSVIDAVDLLALFSPMFRPTVLVAELIATLEAINSVASQDITEAGIASDTYVRRVEALVALLEAAQAVDTNTASVHIMQASTDSAAGAAAITSTGSLITALLSEGAVATIRLYIGGEVFTGWVLNTDTLAPSEYQFVDRQFNSACKHGDRYLLAAEDGIYEFTEATGVETVMTYIKTGKTDFGSDLKKRVVNSYIVYSASDDMVLKVTTSEFGNLVTRNYRVAAQADDTTDTRRVDIGKGVKSRYWQFELVGDGVDCDIDELGMLPVVLSRRI